MSVKTMRYEIVGWSGEPQETKRRWGKIADDCREIVNVIWQQWEVWHVAKGNDVKCQEYATALRAFRKQESELRDKIKTANEAKQSKLVRDLTEEITKLGKRKPKLSVVYMTPELSKIIRRKLNDRFPGVHSRIKDVLLQTTTKKMNGKDVDGRWNVWLSVLLNRQGRPNSTHEQPIPFDNRNSKPLTLVNEKYTNYVLQISLTRLPSDKKNSLSIEDTVQLKARSSGLVIMQRIVSGEYKFCNSSIVYHQGRNKWYALIAYDDHLEDKQVGKLSGTAILHPTRNSPWALWIGSRWEWFGGTGMNVEWQRKSLLTSRWSRQENYRWAGSSNKGHGRDRAMEGVQKLSEGWKDFVKTFNHCVTAEVVKYCVYRKIARLVYLQPAGDKRDGRFLSKAGKIPGRVDSTGWDWSQVASMLAYKCQDAGIHLEIRKCDASGRKIKSEKAA